MDIGERAQRQCSVTAQYKASREHEQGLFEYFGRCGSRSAILRGVEYHLRDYFELLALFEHDDGAVRWVEGAGPGLEVPPRLRQWADAQDYCLLNHCIVNEQAFCGELKARSGEDDEVIGFLQSRDRVTWCIPLLGGEHVEYVMLARGATKRPLSCTQRLETVIGHAAMALQRIHVSEMLLKKQR